MTNSNLVGCVNRQVGGLGAFENRPDVMTAHRRKAAARSAIVAHQAAVNCILSIRVHHYYIVTCCQLQYFVAIAGWVKERREATHYERVGSLLDKDLEGGLEVETAGLPIQ